MNTLPDTAPNNGNFGNVVDQYKGMTTEEIKNEIQKLTLPFAPIMMQIHGDFNFSTLIRNGNAFGAQEIFYYGPRKKFDKRGAIGSYHYSDVIYLSSINQIIDLRSKYSHFIAMDIIPGVSTPLKEHKWEPNSLLFFGEEQQGLQPEILEICDKVVHIEQRGSVRSVNVGTASGIAMHSISMELSK